MKRILIIGAGPAGLTAAYELLKRSNAYTVTVLEESDCFGGISRTVTYKGNRMDMGGHRFFSKTPEVNSFRKMGGNFGNDLFSVLFILLTLLLALRWYEEPTLRRILPLAFSIGLGMMAKLSAWTAASSFGMYTLR